MNDSLCMAPPDNASVSFTIPLREKLWLEINFGMSGKKITYTTDNFYFKGDAEGISFMGGRGLKVIGKADKTRVKELSLSDAHPYYYIFKGEVAYEDTLYKVHLWDCPSIRQIKTGSKGIKIKIRRKYIGK